MKINLEAYRMCLTVGVFLTFFFLKTVILFAVLMLKGSLFQRRGAAIANDLSPQLRFDFAS